MKRTMWWLSLIATALVGAATSSLYAQEVAQPGQLHGYTTVIPLHGRNVTQARHLATAASTGNIPMWSYNITSHVDGKPYSGMMVGRSPFFHGARSTNIPTILIPLKFVMPDGNTFDPSKADPNCLPAGQTGLGLVQNSPLFQAASISMGGVNVGNTQYVDAFQRASFWTNVSVTGNSYHTIYNVTQTLPVQTITVPNGDGQTFAPAVTGKCGNIGVVSLDYLANLLEGAIIPNLSSQGVNPSVVPIFLTYNVVAANQGTDLFSNCCTLGFHSAFTVNGGSQIQTVGISDYDGADAFQNNNNVGGDIDTLSHELAELTDDPLGINLTPAWGKVGQVTGCQNNLEVGDPLSGTGFPPIPLNGFTYHPQELAFFSWFFRQSPSLGINGWDSDNGTFTSGQPTVCQ